MVSLKMRHAVLLVVVLLSVPAFSADTWRLDSKQDWQEVSPDSYEYNVAQLKAQVSSGDTKAARKTIEKLKKDFPQVSGEDMDSFLQAEILFAQGKLTKAAKAYEKFLTQYSHSRLSGLYDVVLERQFAIATAFLAGKKKRVFVFTLEGYAEGEKMMEKIAGRAGDSPLAQRAQIAIAQSLEKRELFAQAYEKWSEINSIWPAQETGEKALLAMGRCKHAAYRGPKFDSSALVSAKSYYQDYIQKTPPEKSTEYSLENRVDQITEQRAYKQFTIGQYYQRTGKIRAANLYYDMVINDWPGTVAAKMAKKNMESMNFTEKENEK